MPSSVIASVSLHQLEIPLRRRVHHAAAVREVADPILLALASQSGVTGYGETLPRRYVTGEDHRSVQTAVDEVFIPRLLQARPSSFAAALEFIEQLPDVDPAGKPVPAARAAVELALLDLYGRHFGRCIGEEVCRWLELPGFGLPGCLESVRCSGVLAGKDSAQVLRSLRRMRCFGLRDFKLKVGTPAQDRLVPVVAGALRGGLGRGTTLRLDANGAWSLDTALQTLAGWSGLGVVYIEQPLAVGDEENLQDLKAHTGWRIIHDESLVTLADGEELVALGVADCFNIRISKCGGFIPALRLADFCRRHDIAVTLGCMVGQTGLLSAVERRFLQCVPHVRFVEGNFGRFLLQRDVARPHVRFGFRGRLRPLHGAGWGVEISEASLSDLGGVPPRRWRL